MYNTTSNFKSDLRQFDACVLIGEKQINREDILDFSIKETFGNEGIPSLGGVGSNTLSLNLLRNENTDVTYNQVPIKPFIRLTGETWIPIGVFYANSDEIKKDKFTISINCFDILALYNNILFESTLSYPTTMAALCSEIEKQTLLQFDDLTPYNTIVVNEDPQGKNSIRVILSDLGVISSTNCHVNHDGKIEFKKFTPVDFSLDGHNYITFNKLSDNEISLTKLNVTYSKYGEDELFEYGDDSGITVNVKTDNIHTMAETIEVYNRIFPYTFMPYDLNCQGMPHLECGDIITLTDVDNNTYNLPICNHALSYNGKSVLSTFTADCPSSDIQIGELGDSYFAKVNRYFNQKIDITEKSNNEVINNTAKEITEQFDVSLATYNEGILSTVKKEYTEKGEFDDYKNVVETQFLQQSDNFTMSFDNLKTHTQDLNGQTQTQIDEIRSYIRFDSDGIEIGKEESDFKSNFTNESLTFSEGDTVVAEIKDGTFYGKTSVVVDDELKIGNATKGTFKWVVRDNGHFSLKVGE